LPPTAPHGARTCRVVPSAPTPAIRSRSRPTSCGCPNGPMGLWARTRPAPANRRSITTTAEVTGGTAFQQRRTWKERFMTKFAVSRRALLGTGVGVLIVRAALPPAAGARTWAGLSTTNEAIIRKYYGGWERKDWELVDKLLADNFTFTSAAPDDHISKTAFKKQCWNTQSALIEKFDLELVFG